MHVTASKELSTNNLIQTMETINHYFSSNIHTLLNIPKTITINLINCNPKPDYILYNGDINDPTHKHTNSHIILI